MRSFFLRLRLIPVVTVILCAILSAQVQNAPTTEPRGKEEPSHPVAKGAAAITHVEKRCLTELVVNADALFAPHRWTLNPDASQTLDVLGSMIAKIGKPPTNIVGYTESPGSGSADASVDQFRAVTVRTWLSNHHFIPVATTIGGLTLDNSIEPPAKALHTESQRKNGVIWIRIGTCE